MPRPIEHPKLKFWKKVKITVGCWIWTASYHRDGYGRFHYENRNQRAHRVAWILFRGKVRPDQNVCHKCDNPKCVRPAHLFLGSHHDNAMDKVRKGRASGGSLAGEKNPKAKLTRGEVSEIRALMYWGVGASQLAEYYDVNYTTIKRLKQGGWQQ